MPIFEQFKVNNVQPSYTGPNRPSGFGFDITNRHGSRLLSVVYASKEEADAAQEVVAEALAKALAVVTTW